MKLHILPEDRRLGFRIIKTGIAVTLCMAVAQLINLNSPFFAVIAAVIAMGQSIDSSIRAGKNRVIGTCIGALVGMGLAMVQPGNIGLCGVGIIITLYCCHALHLHDSSAIACIVFLAIMLNMGSEAPWLYAMNRIIDTFIGILIALLVNVTIMPPNTVGKIRESYRKLCLLFQESIQQAKSGGKIDVRAIETEIARMDSAQNQYVKEMKFLRGRDEEVFAVSCNLSIFREMLYELYAVGVLEERPPADPRLAVVFEYHMDRLAQMLIQVLPQETKQPTK